MMFPLEPPTAHYRKSGFDIDKYLGVGFRYTISPHRWDYFSNHRHQRRRG